MTGSSRQKLRVLNTAPAMTDDHMALPSPNREQTTGNQTCTEGKAWRLLVGVTERDQQPLNDRKHDSLERQRQRWKRQGTRKESQGRKETSPTGSGPRCKEERRRKKEEVGKGQETETRRLSPSRNSPPPGAFGHFPTNNPTSVTLFLPATCEGKQGGMTGDPHTTTDTGRQTRRTGTW